MRDGKKGNLSVAFSGLHPAFVDSMAALFKVMDVESKGWIHVEEFSQNWRPDELDQHLPANLVESLRKTATVDGKLTFERLCAGLKIAILRHEAKKNKVSSMESPALAEQKTMEKTSTPLATMRTNSLPDLLGQNGRKLKPFASRGPSPVRSESAKDQQWVEEGLLGPPKPPRDPSKVSLSLEDKENQTPAAKMRPFRHHHRDQQSARRRHTLQGGFDTATIRRQQIWAEKRNVLDEGLTMVRRVHAWYVARMERLRNDDEANADRANTSMRAADAHHERHTMELQSLRDLNQRLEQLTSFGSPPMRAHNGASPPPLSQQEAARQKLDADRQLFLERQVERLKQQNKVRTID